MCTRKRQATWTWQAGITCTLTAYFSTCQKLYSKIRCSYLQGNVSSLNYLFGLPINNKYLSIILAKQITHGFRLRAFKTDWTQFSLRFDLKKKIIWSLIWSQMSQIWVCACWTGPDLKFIILYKKLFWILYFDFLYGVLTNTKKHEV